MAQMAKGGIVMDVINAKQAKIAEAAGVGTAQTITSSQPGVTKFANFTGLYF